LSETIERIENKQRMADGTLRRYSIAKKRTWSCSWDLLPSSNNVVGALKTADLGLSGEEIEVWANTVDVPFRMILRRGSARDLATPNPAEGLLPYSDANFYIANVMITDFDKDIVKRGRIDLWNVSITLEEV